MRIVRLALAIATLSVAASGVALAAEPKSGSKTGTARVQCESASDKPVCGARVAVQGSSAFTVTPSKPVDLDVYFYTGKNELTDQFTTTGCTVETGRTSEDARYAIVVIPKRPTCGDATSVEFTYAYRVIPKPRCPDEVNASCRPLWANLAAFGLVALLLGPVIALVAVHYVRRARDRQSVAS